MIRVLIFEDNVFDVDERYSGLLKGHDVSIRLVYHPSFDLTDRVKTAQLSNLISSGFDQEKIRWGLDGLSNDEADIFFVDGLVGRWQDVMARLPRDRAFLNTENLSYPILAKSQGYKVLEGSPEDKIRELFE